MSSSARKRSRLTESEPAPRRSERIHDLELARSQSTHSALPALRTRDSRSRAKAFVPPSHEDEFSKLEESLLPGICNDVVLPKISTLLPNESLQILSSVGSAWRQAIENRLVYDARVLADSGESFVVISDTKSSDFHDEGFTPAIYLYSLRSYTRYQLPPIAQLVSGIPYDCECIALDGRVYVLGGTKTSSRKSQKISIKDVYVLDLAAPRQQWKLCAKMQAARANFKCGAIDGKIYAFGGTCGREWVTGSEVYDPSVNSWSTITPLTTPLTSWPSTDKGKVNRRALYKLRRCSLHNSASTDGEKLVVVSEGQEGGLYHLTAYYPVEDKWRVLSKYFSMFVNGLNAVTIIIKGKLHSISLNSICVYDIDKNKWTMRYSCSFAWAQPQFPLGFSSVVVDNEIIAIVKGYPGLDRCFVRSIGFGSDVKKIVWEQLQGSFPAGYENPSMCFLKI